MKDDKGESVPAARRLWKISSGGGGGRIREAFASIASPRRADTMFARLKGDRMKPILGAVLLFPLMSALALAQEPTADAKEGRFYLEGGVGFGVQTMAAPSTSSK